MPGREPSQEARALHRECVVVDLHADTPVLLRHGYDLGKAHRAFLPRGAFGFHVDLPRLSEGGVGAQFFGLVPPPFPAGRAAAAVHAQLDALESNVARYEEQVVLAVGAGQVRAARAAGRIAALRGIEGGHALEGNIDRLVEFARRGVRYLTLVHFTRNLLAAPAVGLGSGDDRGLTDFGRAVIDAAPSLGVIVDLAHINRRGFLEATALSSAPPLVSHTGVRGVADMWRNIDDDQVRAVARKGGVVGIIFAPLYLGRNSIDALVDHLVHVIDVGGAETPALGSDYDGLIVPATGLRDVSCMPRVTDALLRRGLGVDVIRKILGENALRLLSDVPPAAFGARP